jgi:hypothetical protein
VNRKRRVADDSGIAGAEHRKAQMTEAFLAANAGEHFLVRVEFDAVIFGVLDRDFFS